MRAGRKKTALICGLILVVAGIVAAVIFTTEPTARREGAVVKTAMLVDVIGVERGRYRPQIVATGVVRPAQDVALRPQVGGVIISRAPDFVPGGFVSAGEVLVRIEPADYRNTVRQREADLRQAVANLEIEMGRQDVARLDYDLFGKALSPENKALVLREPQLETARVAVASARAALAQAKLELARTSVEAPFSAHVVTQEANVGSRVSPTDTLGRLVGIETYWVEVAVPLAKLQWISVGEPGSDVKVRNRSAWPAGVYRSGHAYKLVGALDEQTRMARVLVAIGDPMARRSETRGPPLIVGEFVEAQIDGEPLDDVVRLDRDYLREGDTVWLMKDRRLLIRQVEVVARDADHAYIGDGLAAGDQVVTSDLSTVTEGAKLRLRDRRAPEGGD